MKHTPYILIAIGIVLLLTVSSCKLGKAYVRPEMELPEQLDSLSQAGDTFSLADMHWWEIYGDTILQQLIRKTLANNKDMLASIARVKELAALKRVDLGKMLPRFDADIHANREVENYGGNDRDVSPEIHGAMLISWEIDLWGRLRWAYERSNAELLQAIDNQRALQVSLVAQVAQSYYELSALDNELAIVKQTLRAREEGLRLAKLRFEGGLTSETPYQQAQVELARTATMVPDLERAIAIKENEIALLAGEFPYPIRRMMMDEHIELLPDELPAGLPSSLLERRPDVQAAEKALIAANADVGIAFTSMFPRLSLTANWGLESEEFKDFFNSPYTFISANLLAPLFSFGQNRARWKAQEAAYEREVYLYEKQVLVAFKDARDAIITFNKSKDVYNSRKKLEQAAYSNNKLANLQYIKGYISYLDVLDAQRGYFDAQISLSQAVLGKQLALVQLYKALGGGWE